MDVFNEKKYSNDAVFINILPSHRPVVEKILENIFSDKLDSMPVNDISINPDTCTLNILKILAASYSVNIDGLDEKQARRMVKSAFNVKRHKGTVYALKTAIKSLYPDAELNEKDEPFTFSIKVKLSEGDLYIPDEHKVLCRVVEENKNARSHFDSVEVEIPEIKTEILANHAVIFSI